MSTSQNGWPIIGDYGDPALTNNPTVPGTDVQLLGGVRAGDVCTVLVEAARRWHTTVEPLQQALGCWGFDPQHNSYVSASNHKSGTAIDLNASRHPIGTAPGSNFTAAGIVAVRRIVAWSGGVIRSGIDYSGRKDGMHLEINVPPGDPRLAALAATITAGTGRPDETGDDDMPLTDAEIDKIAAATAQKVWGTESPGLGQQADRKLNMRNWILEIRKFMDEIPGRISKK